MKHVHVVTVFLFAILPLASAGGGRDSGAGNFPATIEIKVGDDNLQLARTGSAVRHRGRIKLDAIASYLKQGVKVGSAQELIAADSPKQLHLVMQRFIPASAMAQAFQAALRLNYPAPAFTDELRTVTDLFQKASLDRGQHVRLTHIPKVGLRCQREGGEVLIRNVEFSKAIWEMYLGKTNVEEAVKRGLVSDL